MFAKKEVKEFEKSILQEFDDFFLFQYTLRFVKDRSLTDYTKLMHVSAEIKKEPVKADIYLSDDELLTAILDAVQFGRRLALPYNPHEKSVIEANEIIGRLILKYRTKIEEISLIDRSDYSLSDLSREVDLESILMAWEDVLNPETRKELGLLGNYALVGCSDIECLGEQYEDATIIHDIGITSPELLTRSNRLKVESNGDNVILKIDKNISPEEMLLAFRRIYYEISDLNNNSNNLCLNLERGGGVIVDRYDKVRKRLIGLLCWDYQHKSGTVSDAIHQVYEFLCSEEGLLERDEDVIKRNYYDVKREIDQVEMLQERKRANRYVGLNLGLSDRN